MIPADVSRVYIPGSSLAYLACRDCRWESPALASDDALSGAEKAHTGDCPTSWLNRPVAGLVEPIEGVIVGLASAVRPGHWTNRHRQYVVRLSDGSEVVTDAAFLRTQGVTQ